MNRAQTFYETLGETPLSRKFVVGCFAGMLGTTVWAMSQIGNSPEYEYEKNFTDSGKCLEGTPFDPDEAARVTAEAVDGTKVVQVIPKDANNQTPSILFITETDQGWYGFGDNKTAAYLVSRECENIPEGY